MSTLQVPPHNLDAEIAVLSAMFRSPEHVDQVVEQLQIEDFYVYKHQRIFAVMRQLSLDGIPLDTLTVADELKKTGDLTLIGGYSYLHDLDDQFLSAANLSQHIRIVHEKALTRSLIAASATISVECFKEHDDFPEFLDRVDQILAKAARGLRDNANISMHANMVDFIDTFETTRTNGGRLTGLASGFYDLDSLTIGFQKGDLIILAARPSVGKSTVALNIAEFCVRRNIPVGFFSLEMSRQQLSMRLLSSISQIDYMRLKKASLFEHEHARLHRALGVVSELPLWIDDQGGQDILDLRIRARRMVQQKKIQLLIVDYLQLMRGSEHRDNRVLEIGDISRRLKLLAKELQIPIILLCQLNRQVEGRSDKRPIMSDLRESGNLEQDADLILLLYRESMYVPTAENKHKAELIIGKQRNGPTGVIQLHFRPDIVKFASTARESGQQVPPEYEELVDLMADDQEGDEVTL